MREIINEFFSKDSKTRNVTIAELLKEYCIEERLFWNYVYNLDPIIVAKIKDENKNREINNNSLEIYRLTKDGSLTFGDIARSKETTVNQVVEFLQNPFLNSINHYNFENIQTKNMELLKQRKEFDLYFYFLEHNVTFEQLGKQFGLDESQVIYFFDSVLDSEFTEEQIKKVFALNKSRENKPHYQQNKKQLRDLFVLTEEENQWIDGVITNLEKTSSQFYRKRIETLKCTKMYLSSEVISMEESCHKLNLDIELMRQRFEWPWLNETLLPSMRIKKEICNLIEKKRIYICPQTKFLQIEHYMRMYAEYLNCSDLSIQTIYQKYNVDISQGSMLDKKLKTTIFSEISKIIEKLSPQRKVFKLNDQINEYYQNHFILFRDLGPIFNIPQNELLQYYNQPENKNIWTSICAIEEQRIKKINHNIKRLSYFSNLLSSYQINSKQADNCNSKLYDDLIELIGRKRFISIIKKPKMYMDGLIQALLITCNYIGQANYDINNLLTEFHIKSDCTICRGLKHEQVVALLDTEIGEYIHTKRKIAGILGARKGNQIMLQNQTHQYNERNEKGQFVKKSRPSENQE